MSNVIPLHRGVVINGCDGDCRQGRKPCQCGIGALTEADLDRHEAERVEVLRYPRTLAEAFPAEHANPITRHRRPSLLRQAAEAIRAAWRDTFEGQRR